MMLETYLLSSSLSSLFSIAYLLVWRQKYRYSNGRPTWNNLLNLSFFIFNGPLEFSWVHEKQVASGQRRYTVFGKEDRHNFFHDSTSNFTLNQASHSHNLKYYSFTGNPPNCISLDFSDLQNHHLRHNHRRLKLNKSKTKLSASSLNLPQSPHLS